MCSQSSWAFFSSAKDLFFLQIWLRFLILPTVQCWGLSCPDCKWADYRRTGGVIQPLRGLQREDVKNINKFLEVLFNFTKKYDIYGTAFFCMKSYYFIIGGGRTFMIQIIINSTFPKSQRNKSFQPNPS